MNLDKFFWRYPAKGQTCFELACEVWEHITGQDISDTMQSIARREAGSLKRFRRLEKPESPCIALFQGVGHRTHCGVYIDGRVLHLASEGTMCVPVTSIMPFGFKSVKYYAVDSN